MKKISTIMNKLVARKENAEKNENGFSLIELVVAIAILLVLSVGGLLGYSAITDNARTSSASSAASEVSTSIATALSDDDADNNAAAVNPETYKKNFPKVTITITPDSETAPKAYTVTAKHQDGGKQAERTVTP